MTYGLQITNDSNQVIIDSDLFGYHFIGKYSPVTNHYHNHLQDLGGEDYWDTPNNIDFNQTPGRVFEYSIYLPNANKPPMCFIKPTGTGTSASYASVIRVWKHSSTHWMAWVLQSSASYDSPTIYAFSTTDQTNSAVSDTYGMQTFNSSGQVTFDSRRKPLRVVGAATVYSPGSPNTGSLGSGTTPYLNVNIAPHQYGTGANTAASDQIYYCPSLASACNEYELGREYSGTHNWSYYTWSRYDLWWCFYRSAYRILDQSAVHANWAIYMAGHIWKAQVAGSFLGLGYLNGIPVVGADAYYPYSDSARNQDEGNAILISKASYYD
tara:strand:- start:267 stop:1238 length:972 start_codon:yes stop_codon:yes gene_type:complete